MWLNSLLHNVGQVEGLVQRDRVEDVAADSGKYTGWGINISDVSKGHYAGCSGGREVGVVSWGWLASTVVSTHNELDR